MWGRNISIIPERHTLKSWFGVHTLCLFQFPVASALSVQKNTSSALKRAHVGSRPQCAENAHTDRIVDGVVLRVVLMIHCKRGSVLVFLLSTFLFGGDMRRRVRHFFLTKSLHTPHSTLHTPHSTPHTLHSTHSFNTVIQVLSCIWAEQTVSHPNLDALLYHKSSWTVSQQEHIREPCRFVLQPPNRGWLCAVLR